MRHAGTTGTRRVLNSGERGNSGNLPVVTAATRYAGKPVTFPRFPRSRRFPFPMEYFTWKT